MKEDEFVNFGSVNRQNSINDPLKKQSQIDPDRTALLYNYNLDSFKNSIWENFIGSNVQISKIIEEDGTSKITNKIVSKLGPIQLSLDHENLYSAWEHSTNSEIKDYKGINKD